MRRGISALLLVLLALVAATPTYVSSNAGTELANSYVGARYYSSNTGRFIAPDQPGVDQSPGDAQSWLLFGFVRQNPLRWVDRNGREACHVILDNGDRVAADECVTVNAPRPWLSLFAPRARQAASASASPDSTEAGVVREHRTESCIQPGWYRMDGEAFVLGRRRSLIEERSAFARFLSNSVPAAHAAAVLHDRFVGFATGRLRLKDKYVNVPSMPFAYAAAVNEQVMRTVGLEGLVGYSSCY